MKIKTVNVIVFGDNEIMELYSYLKTTDGIKTSERKFKQIAKKYSRWDDEDFNEDIRMGLEEGHLVVQNEYGEFTTVSLTHST